MLNTIRARDYGILAREVETQETMKYTMHAMFLKSNTCLGFFSSHSKSTPKHTPNLVGTFLPKTYNENDPQN